MTPTRETGTTRPAMTTRPQVRGALTALVTPFEADGTLDQAAFRRLVRWQILAGIDGLVPCGTTGESPTLSPEEREWLIATTVEVAAERPSRDRITVVAGTGTNDTAATIRATRRAAELGADAALVVAPYYNRPDGRMLDAHFRADRRRGRPAGRRLQRPVADRGERRCGHVPATRRAPADRRDQGGQRQPRADRPDLPRPAARRRGPGRRRRLDPAGARDGRRRRRLRRVQRGPGRARRAVRRRARRGLGRRPAHPRPLAPAVPGQLPGRPEPGPGQGRARPDGPARLGHGAGAAPARSRQRVSRR